CQVPVSCLFAWEMFNTSVPRPARLSWSVPVQVPVKGLGSLSLEQPRRPTTRASIHHRHTLHRMQRPSLARCDYEPRPGAYPRGRRGPLRSSRGRASLTLKVRPPSVVPWSPAIAACASVVSGIVTKPKPRGRPVSRSWRILTRSTTPYASNSWRNSCSVAVYARLPTKISMDTFLSARAFLRHPAWRSQTPYFLHASEIGWFHQFGRIIGSEHPFREFDGLRRQRKIVSACAIRGASIKDRRVHRDIR